MQAAPAVLPLFGLSLIPMALNLICTAFLFSTKRTGAANAIAASRGMAGKTFFIFCFPSLFEGDAVWIAPFAAEMVTLMAAAGLSAAVRFSRGAGPRFP